MIFIDNKYTKIYFRLIENRKSNQLSKALSYCETHHVIPRSLGGSNDENNLVNLTAREHYIAHKLLTKMTVGKNQSKMFWALHRIIHSKNSSFKMNSRNYENFRIQWSEFLSANHPSKVTDHWCEFVSESIRLSWENDTDRKIKTSERMKRLWSEGKLKKEQARINGNHGLKGKDVHNTLEIEYNGVVYYGWRELKEITGVSKALYTKYYLNGLDPTPRIGKNGPNLKNEIMPILRKEVSE